MRPDVVWYGEMLPEDVLQAAFEAAGACDVFFSIGTSAVVQPAASLPLVAKRAGAMVAEINVEPTVISDRLDESIIGKSGDILPLLLQEAFGIDL
jgi:NAD-dependent deacetylase